MDWTPQAATASVAAVTYAGNFIESAPRDLGNVLISYWPSLLRGGRIAAEWSHTGTYATDPTNLHYNGGYELVNLHFNTNITARTELFARLANVLGRPYAELETWDNFLRRQITPGAPRSVYLGAKTGW